MHKMKENWLVLLKMTWGIWQIFTRVLESLKIGTLMGFFDPKKKVYELKIYRGAMCHDNEEWCEIWRGIDLSVQHWHEEFKKFWSRVMFHGTVDWCKIWRKTDLYFQWWHENLSNFHRLKNSYHFRKFNGETESKQKLKTTRSTGCSVKAFFCHGNKGTAQLTKHFTPVLQNRCS